MAAIANIVQQQSSSTGTGNFTLTTVNGRQSFDAAFGHAATLNVFDYFIMNRNAGEWERGTGHMSDATTLARDTVIESTNANAAVNFSAGVKDVTNAIPAGNQVKADDPRLSAPPIITSAKVDQDGRVYLSRVNTYSGNGTSDDTAAVQTALDAIAARPRGGALILPSGGLVRLNSAATFTADVPISVMSEGNRRGCTIDQRGASAAFSFTGVGGSSNQAIYLSGMRPIANVAATACVIANGPENVQLENFRPTAGTGQWAVFFNGTGIRTSTFRHIYARNDHGLGTSADITGIMFRLNTSGVGSTDNRFDDMTLQGFENAFNCDASGSPGNEGNFLQRISMVNCKYGILWRHSSGGGYVPPLLHAINCHFNCFRQWADFSAVAQIDISHCTLELDSSLGNTDNGLTMSNLAGWHFCDNRAFFTNGSRAARAIVAFSGAVQGDCHHNTFNLPGGVNAIELQAGANNNKVSFNKSTGATNCASNGGTGNDVATSNTTF